MAEADISGANPESAHTRGGDGITVAETFSEVVNRFDTATEDLATTLHGPFSDDKVPFRRTYRSYGEEHVDTMRQIQEHGRRLSGNVQAGAIEISGTDDTSAEEYRRHGEPLPPRDSVLVEGNFEFVNRHLNKHVNERWVPGSDVYSDHPQIQSPDNAE